MKPLAECQLESITQGTPGTQGVLIVSLVFALLD